MKARVILVSVVAIVTVLSYFLGKRFGYWEQHNSYWIIVGASLLSIGLIADSRQYSSTVTRGCAFGFAIGWLLSTATFVALQMVTECESTYGVIDALGRFPWYELLFFELTIALARFGWLPFVAMFGLTAFLERHCGK